MIFFNFFCEISYFREIFDLSHFYGPDDKLYHPNHYSPGNRPKLAFTGGHKKTNDISQRRWSFLQSKNQQKSMEKSGPNFPTWPGLAKDTYSVLFSKCKNTLFFQKNIFQSQNRRVRIPRNTIQLSILYTSSFPKKAKEAFIFDSLGQQKGITVFQCSRE